MDTRKALAEETIRKFLRRANKPADFEPGTSLFGDGLGLDSLETAELSATLEDELGNDPFSEGDMPRTVGELIAFY